MTGTERGAPVRRPATTSSAEPLSPSFAAIGLKTLAVKAGGDAVDQRLPRGFDDVAGNSHGFPGRRPVARLDQDAGRRVRTVRRVQDAHAVVDELEPLELG